MIIPYAFIESAVIKREALERCEKGLSLKLIKEYKLDSARYDDDLIIIPIAMSDYDAELVAKELEEKYGLVHLTEDGKAQDFAVYNGLYKSFIAYNGLCRNFDEYCDWLKHCYLEKNLTIGTTTYKKNQVYFKLIKTS